MYTPSFLRTPVEPERAPRRDESQPIRIVPMPVPVVCPPPPAASTQSPSRNRRRRRQHP